MIKVSVLIPVHNAEQWVAEAIKSALSQSHCSAEIIVFDDGSTDNSLNVIRSFCDRIRWESGPHRGGGVARNRLLAMARAPWVQYLDADDYLQPWKLAGQLADLERQPDIDVLYSAVAVEHYVKGGLVRRDAGIIPEPHDPWSLLALWQLPQTGGPLWRREALFAVGGWREDQPCCQEHELYFRLLVSGARFSFTKADGAVYRRFDDGTVSTRNAALVRRERARIEDKLENYLEANGLLTLSRQWAINQARFDMARSAWPENRFEALEHHAAIRVSNKRFCPSGPSAPRLYRLAYRLFGFERAEAFAATKRVFTRA